MKSVHIFKGWLEIPNRKLSQSLRFYKLRGHFIDDQANVSTVQLISRHEQTSPLARKLDSITSESCVAVSVRQLLRPKDNQRTEEAGEQGKYEYEIQDIRILNMAASNLPFLPTSDNLDKVDSLVKAQNRHLELRSSSLSSSLRARAEIKKRMRTKLEGSLGFMEIETPILFKSTPEGAREFLVPTRKHGQFFALPQSPQQYKQILMAGGVYRYYQFAKCFRDEDSRADRQLEFTQLDLEMSFVDGMEDVMRVIEETVLSVESGATFNYGETGSLASTSTDLKIRRLKYMDVMQTYGSDKPDLRFDLHITSLPIPGKQSGSHEMVDYIIYESTTDTHLNGKLLKDLRQELKDIGVYAIRGSQEVGWRKLPPTFEPIASSLPQPVSSDSVLLLSRRQARLSGGSTSMGQARLALQSILECHAIVPIRQKRPFELCWITDFPLFSPTVANEPGQGGTAGLCATHHPFTAPHPDDVHLLDSSDPEDSAKVRGLHYDLVMNGVEIGGGSIRIHNSAMQRKVFRVLGMSDARISQFDHLLKVLESGCPPHGGFALGFDRFVAMMCGKTSIRDVIAFPKTSSGVDALIGSPTTVPDATLAEYHIKVVDDIKN